MTRIAISDTLSLAQADVWLADQRLGRATPYQVTTVIKISGPPAPNRIADALNILIDRHEALRAAFLYDAHGIRQDFRSSAELEITRLDWSEQPIDQVDGMLHELAGEVSAARIDLSEAPLVRGTLVRLPTDLWALVLTMHHLIFDGWSADILTRELAETTAALDMDRAVALPPLRRRFLQHVQAQWADPRAHEESLHYWADRLAGVPKPAGTGKVQPGLDSAEARHLPFTVSAPDVRALSEICASHHVAMTSVLLAGYAGGLRRLLGQNDVVVGTAVSLRTEPGYEDMIGLMVTLLPLRLPEPGQTTLAGMAVSAQDEFLAGLEHPSFSLTNLIADRGGRAATEPLFESILNPVLPPRSLTDSAGRTWRHFTYVNSRSVANIELRLHAHGAELGGMLTYRPDRVPDHQARLLATDLIHTLSVATHGEGANLSDHPRLHGAGFHAMGPSHLSDRDSGALATGADWGASGAAGRRLITAIWARLLNLVTVGPDDDFWDIGAESLTVAMAGYEVSSALGVELPVALFYRYTSVREWEEFLCAELGPQEVEFRAELSLGKMPGGGVTSRGGGVS